MPPSVTSSRTTRGRDGEPQSIHVTAQFHDEHGTRRELGCQYRVHGTTAVLAPVGLPDARFHADHHVPAIQAADAYVRGLGFVDAVESFADALDDIVFVDADTTGSSERDVAQAVAEVSD